MWEVPRLKFCLSTGRSLSVKRVYLRDRAKRPQRMSIHQTLWFFLTPCLLLHQPLAINTPANTEEKCNDSEPADIQMEYSSDQLYTPRIGALKKNDVFEIRCVGFVP
jgi:hypothetical protein